MFASIALLATAVAQPQAVPIVVEGRDTRQTATEYVEKLLPSAIGSELGRFEDPVCPKVIGLSEPFATQVIDRIRQVAKATNIGVARSSCTPNLLLITTRDKGEMIDVLRKSRPRYVEDVPIDALKRLANSPRPYVSWQLTEEMAADGMPIGKGNNMPAGTNGAFDPKTGSRRVDADFPRLKTTQSPSRLRNTVKPRVVTSIVIVESSALDNVTTGQLADFAFVKAMLPIETREREAPTSSILSLFNPGVAPASGPQSVTWWDVAFLKSLTSTKSDKGADLQKSEIRQEIIREVNKTHASR